MGKNKMILLLILVFGLGCAGCTEKKPAAEQGELVKSERLSEQFGSLSILLRYKTLRLNNCASHSRYFDELNAQIFYQKKERMFTSGTICAKI